MGWVVLGAAAAIAATAALMRTVVRRRRAGATQARRGLSCGCGQKYEVAGTDRHRIYWPAGAPQGAPVLGDHCVVCEAPLPAEHDAAAA